MQPISKPVLWMTVIALMLPWMASCAKEAPAPAVDGTFQKKLQEDLIRAKPGGVIELPAGKFQLDRPLSLTVDHVTLRGKGMDKTVLSFKGQKAGAEGLLVNVKGSVTLEDLAIEDTKGDALKVKDADGVIIRRVRTEWTNGPNPKNGSYGIYPVQCKNVLIEDSVALGASDAGIYVGQSKNIIVRRNRAELNVAGIEIENSQDADVYENVATRNTGGILVFDLPDLPVRGGRNTRVFNNQVYSNNTENFAPKGNTVALVPTGTGVMIMANDNIEVFKNTIQDHGTGNVMVISYHATEKPIKDKLYDAYPETIYIHDNIITGGGTAPGGLLLKGLALAVGKPLPSILYDGIIDPKKADAARRLPDHLRLCIKNNGAATFLNMDAGHTFKNINRDLAPHDCAHPPIPPVVLALPQAAPTVAGQ